jgi:hypothetical protein
VLFNANRGVFQPYHGESKLHFDKKIPKGQSESVFGNNKIKRPKQDSQNQLKSAKIS